MKETKSEIGCSSMREMLKDCIQGVQEKIAKRVCWEYHLDSDHWMI